MEGFICILFWHASVYLVCCTICNLFSDSLVIYVFLLNSTAFLFIYLFIYFIGLSFLRKDDKMYVLQILYLVYLNQS